MRLADIEPPSGRNPRSCTVLKQMDALAAIDRAMCLRSNQATSATAPAREQMVQSGNRSQAG
jgi:hypothetical protein